MFIMADILRTMRKEVGLSYFNSIGDNEALAFLSMTFQVIRSQKKMLWMPNSVLG